MPELEREALSFPESHRKLVSGSTVAVMATELPGGSIQMSPMWFDFDGYGFKLSTTTGRQIYHNLKTRRTVSLCIVDESEPGRYIEIRGHVESVVADEGYEFFRGLSARYTGTPDYPFHEEGEVRVVVEVVVERKLCFAPMPPTGG
jgi:PPOX class probable F420-dependent enzyme